MGSFQRAFEEQIAEAPRILLIHALKAKLSALMVGEAEQIAPLIADHIIAGKTSNFVFDDGGSDDGKVISLELDQMEIERLEKSIDTFLSSIRPQLDNIVNNVSNETFKKLKENLSAELHLQDSEFSGFKQRLHDRWGTAFDSLRLLLTAAREYGISCLEENEGADEAFDRVIPRVILRLFFRACQVFSEIIVLMQSGFADGAMARWRTLHEIHVTSVILTEGGSEIRSRYLAHQAVEARASMSVYQECCKSLGYRPISKRKTQAIERQFDKVVKQYGKDFAKPFGWASDYLKIKQPTFRDLEKRADKSLMRSHYKFASQAIHASASFYRLGLLDGEDVLLSGPSNAGFVEPGQNAAHTLTQMCAILMEWKKDIDHIVMMNIIVRISREIPKPLAEAARALRRDHRIQKAKAAT